MSRNYRSVVIESIEPRVLFDAGLLTETIVSSTLPASVSDHAVLHGNVTMAIANNSGIDEKEKVLASVVVSTAPLAPLSLNFYILRNKPMVLSLKAGQSKSFVFPVNIPKGKLPDGNYTIYGLVVNVFNAFSQSAPSFPLTMRPPIVSLSETETFAKLPDSVEVGAPVHFQDKVSITNSGSDPSQDPLTIGLYATPDGLIADGTLVNSITRKIMIPAGKTVNLQVPLPGVPKLGVGTYKLVTQVTQSNSTVTTTDPSTAPAFTVSVPTVGPDLAASIIGTPTTDYDAEPLDGAILALSKIQFLISVKNTGDTTSSSTMNLFASTSPTFDGSAIQAGQIPITVPFPKNGTRQYYAQFGTTVDFSYLGTDVDMYVFVQIVDASGGVTTISYPTPIKFVQSPI